MTRLFGILQRRRASFFADVRALNRSLRLDAAKRLLHKPPLAVRMSHEARLGIARLLTIVEANAEHLDYRALQEDPAIAGRGGSDAACVPEPGAWRLEAAKRGAVDVLGWVPNGTRHVFLFADDVLVKIIEVPPGEAPRAKLRFRFRMRAKLVRVLGARASIVVSTAFGTLSGPAPDAVLRTADDAEESTLLEAFASGRIVNKKGYLILRKDLDPRWQQRVLAAYAELDAYFFEQFGYHLFVAHGSLLGLWRDGGFIPHDDDFDVAYVSTHTSPEAIRDERFEIATRLEADGWRVTIGASGLIKPRYKGSKLLDIMPGWWQDGYFWCQAWTRLPLKRSDLEPFRQVAFLGRSVWIPNDPDTFLRHKYGERWKTPDPAYTPKRPPGAMEVLARGMAEDRELARFG